MENFQEHKEYEMHGGKREGSGRKKIDTRTVTLHKSTLNKLKQVEGRTWNDKLEKLLDVARVK